MHVGQPAPNFTAPNRAGENVSLQDFKGRWLVLYFYPKDNTPGCTTQAIDFTSKLADFHSLNTEIVGISPDSIASHDKFITKHKLEVMLLSDPEHQIADSYEVWQLKKFMGKEYMGIVRSTFLIDPQGNIAQIWPNVKVKNHAEIVLDRLQQVSG
jgi:thioredoxin-dependent peroxiredoxin